MLLIADMFRALEHHVLKEMSKARFTNLLTSGTHVIGYINMHQGIGVIR
ncbi:Uncharacterised protein [Vibrio cholerae]|nr:Uncharacterised protein [Vibrio cholerae]CSC15557.1 Uncharacterised protein [Vibrio cholerae]CSD46096.1 Uncharacterised protein [Vibrio cholerae]